MTAARGICRINRESRFAVTLLLFVAGCSGSGEGKNPASPQTPPTVLPPPPPQFQVIAGGGLTDTVQALPSQSLIVEIRSSDGFVQRGMDIGFEALPAADTTRSTERSILMASPPNGRFTFAVAAKTDSVGRAEVLLKFGTVAGSTGIRVTVATLGLTDTVRYTAIPAHPVRLLLGVKDTMMATGVSYALRAMVLDQFRNSTDEPISYVAGPGVSVNSAGTVVAGSSLARGFVAISSRVGVDTSRVSVVPKWGLVGGRYNGRNFSVYALMADGSELAELASTGSEYMSPQKSMAAGSVTYYQGDPASSASISVVDSKGSGRTIVGSATPFASAYWPRWSSDGQWIYFVGQRRASDGRSLWRVHADATQLDSLTTVDAVGYLTPPAPAPDGRAVAVSDTAGLRIFDVASRTSRIIRSDCAMPRYSPDGSRVACLSNYSAIVMNADGSNRRIIPGGGCRTIETCIEDVAGVDWSPDGQWLLLLDGQAVSSFVNVDDGSRVPLVTLRYFEQLAVAR